MQQVVGDMLQIVGQLMSKSWTSPHTLAITWKSYKDRLHLLIIHVGGIGSNFTSQPSAFAQGHDLPSLLKGRYQGTSAISTNPSHIDLQLSWFHAESAGSACSSPWSGERDQHFSFSIAASGPAF